MQNRRKSMKNMYLKTNAFLTSIFFRFFVDFGSQVEVQKTHFFNDFFKDGPSGAQEAPKRPQEAPKSLQKGSKRGFWRILGLIFGGSWSLCWDFSWICSWHVWASGLAYVPLHVLLYFPYLFGLGGIFQGRHTHGILDFSRRLEQRWPYYFLWRRGEARRGGGRKRDNTKI